MSKKKIVIAILGAVIFVLALNTLTVFIVSNREGNVTFSGSGRHMSSTRFEDGFSVNAQHISGSHRMHINFTASNLNNLQVHNTNTTGQMFLELTQGDIVRQTNITGNFSSNIDTGAFEPGRITIRIIYERAEEISFSINW